MRQTQIFSGLSHPTLVEGICDRLGQRPGKAELRKFSNGETSVQIQSSVRDQDVFIVQSGSSKINDNVMELLIMISACKGGSAKSITAVMPYFPYSRQSKKKSHRGAITARMIANLLHVAGVNHVITIDLHASQMQGFFKCPVDNLVAEPLLARWIRNNVPCWKDTVVVSKNPGGTKRVTSLADALKLSFGIVTTDRRRPGRGEGLSLQGSAIFERLGLDGTYETQGLIEEEFDAEANIAPTDTIKVSSNEDDVDDAAEDAEDEAEEPAKGRGRATSAARRLNGSAVNAVPSSPLAKSTRAESFVSEDGLDSPRKRLMRTATAPSASHSPSDPLADEYTDERARDVIHGRLVHGHIVDDDHPSPAMSAVSFKNRPQRSNSDDDEPPEHMLNSMMSTCSVEEPELAQPMGGTHDAGDTSEAEEDDLKNPELETTVTLVGNVRDRPVCIVDDMIDKSGSWIAAAETVVKRGGATKVYCMATHGLFGGDCLEEMEECECIERIVVTNSFPIPEEKRARCSKLTIIPVESLLAEAIRRNHHGESMSQLFLHGW
ncbi:Ribose-phosphate pyrophosphokinase 1 [Lasiodiplodia theobromae]|uniref:Ribose-phosphate pyrophosphokinase 1 n=1 Tax=Lasiodiplodia theobromae TaxID=45133 RepID=UPI0015C3A1D1|nr:Ribose-phosphate pyrophosphokinase 1 [Lasiodiplodia theobromae]KAF4535892.1 Ribose-phosphate pyrophosphokinase 1 [Lasiodiplodia theobromae]